MWASSVKFGSKEPRFQICNVHPMCRWIFLHSFIINSNRGKTNIDILKSLMKSNRSLSRVCFMPRKTEIYLIDFPVNRIAIIESLIDTLILNPEFYLDGAVQWGTCKCVSILGIKCNLHDIMRVTFKYLSTLPTFIPVPKLD